MGIKYMLDDIRANLAELGISAKETDVYMAMLELGPSSVQDISKKAGVNRSTTYIMIEALKRRGLISSFEKGKKVFFMAESPQRLTQLLEEEMSHIEAKKQRLQNSLPRLLAIFNSVSDKPRVRFFEGEEAMNQVRQEIIAIHEPVWDFLAVDESLLELAKVSEDHRIETSSRTRGRLLFAIKPGMKAPYFDHRSYELKEISYENHPFSGNISIVGDRLYLFSTRTVGLGIIIENKEITDIFRAMYDAVWRQAKPWMPPKEWKKE